MLFYFLDDLARSTERLLNNSNVIRDPHYGEILEFAQKQVAWVEEILRRMDWEGLYSQIWEVRNATKSLSDKLGDASDDDIELDELKQEIQQFIGWVKKMEEYGDALYNPLPPQDEEDGIDVSQSIGLESKMVGLSDVYDELKETLLNNIYSRTLHLVGMPGIGKTTLAMKVFADPDIVKCFEVRVWIPAGRKCSLKDIRRCILARLDPCCLNQMVVERDILHILKERLKCKSYLIVLDDVWEKKIRFQLLPYEREGSCILCTSRLEGSSHNITMRLMNKEESWDLLCEKVFGEASFPTQLEKFGKKIAENCEGLPLTIITIADHLSKVKEVEYWKNVASKKNHKLFKDVYDQISKVLLPSYNYLPRILQICFLYMGVFPQNYEIPRSKLVNMWNVDGFLERNVSFDAVVCLEELVRNSLVMIYQETTLLVGKKNIKICGLHSSLWHLSTTQARKTKFCHVLFSRGDVRDEDLIGQRRLSFHNNILCTIKDVRQSVEDKCASTVRSLFYYGPYNPFQVPICFGLRLVRELDILTVRFYEFPMDILKLVELKYLTLTLDGKLPTSISQLSNLRFLIIGRHFIIIKPSRDRYLPLEIWNMQELKHLQAIGGALPHPGGASLEKLSTLSNVNALNCTQEIFKAVPNLEKLGFLIELGPNDDGIPLRCLDHISSLKKLTSLKCVIVNPNMIIPGNVLTSFRSAMKKFRSSKLGKKERNGNIYHREILRYLKNVNLSSTIEPPLVPITTLPWGLRKLSLSGLGLPWKEMRKIAELPSLEVLKVRNYAFRGPYWRVKKQGFHSLQSLVIEDSDLVEWSIESKCFYFLQSLTLKHCYKYERMVGKLSFFIKKIVLVDCNPLGIQQMKEANPYPHIRWQCHSSFTDEEKRNLQNGGM